MPIDIENVQQIQTGSELTGIGTVGDPLDLTKKEYYQRFDAAASENTLTVTANGGTLPTGTDDDIDRDCFLHQNGKLLIYPDQFTFSGSDIIINGNDVLPFAATYILKFKA
jgi:hypothetical protein